MDPVYMCALLEIPGVGAFIPDDWQEEVLRSEEHTLINLHRQAGKSTVSAMRAYHSIVWNNHFTIVMVSKALRQSRELFDKFMDTHKQLGLVPTTAETKLTAKFANGSRVVSLPGAEGTIRGISAVNLLIIDEASRVPDDLYVAVRPMLAVSHGQLIAPSTPFGQRGWWYKSWQRDNGWKKLEVHADQCSRISEAFLEEERRELGELSYNQEYNCEFINVNEALFHPDDILAALHADDVPTLDFEQSARLPLASVLHSEISPLFSQ